MIRLLLAIGILVGYIAALGFIYLGVVVASIGFLPAMIGSILIWAYVLYTGLIFLEVCALEPLGANIPSLSRKYFGPIGGAASSTIFLLLHYGYSTMYFIFGASLIFGNLQPLIGDIPVYQKNLALFLLYGSFLFLGFRFSVFANFLFACGLIGSLILFFSFGSLPSPHEILFTNWIYLFLGFSGLYDIFFYQSVVPLVLSLLKGNWKHAKVAIWIGTLIPLVLYWLWVWLIVTPEVELGFIQAFENYEPFIDDLRNFYTHFMARRGLELIPFFGFCAGLLTTGLSSFHFFSDLFRKLEMKAPWRKRALISVLIAFPPALLSMLPEELIRKIITGYENFGEVALGAAIPLLFFWSARYIHKNPAANKVYSNKKLIVSLMILTAFFFYIQGVGLLNIIQW